jgi:hypothetical protein
MECAPSPPPAQRRHHQPIEPGPPGLGHPQLCDPGRVGLAEGVERLAGESAHPLPMGAAEIVAGTIGGAPAVVLQRSGEGFERRELVVRKPTLPRGAVEKKP